MVRHLYIHVPFCHRICPYCSFYKHTPGATNQADFVDALLNEISVRAREIELKVTTIYLGGGTPTALSPGNLLTLLSGINQILDLGDLIEWGIEANPTTFDLEKAQLIRSNGVTRVSLGIQSWTPSSLTTLGRDHGPNDGKISFEILRSCDFKSLNIDLMFSVPGQDLEGWENDLEKTINLRPDHVSAYNLNYEEDTDFFERLRKGEFKEDPERDGEFFTSALRILRGAGYEHYEISNYALPGHQSEHNAAYWSGSDYLGIGPGAFSTVNETRWRNIPNTEAYIKSVKSDDLNAIETERERIDRAVFRAERIALELRTARGLELSVLGSIRTDLNELEKEGLLRISDDRVILTDKGKLLADSVATYLL